MKEKIIGRIPVLECLRAGRRRPYRLLLLNGGQDLDEIVQAAGNIPVEHYGRRELDALAKDQVHQGVILEAAPLPLLTVQDWLARDPAADAFVIVLDEIEDPHNFGAVLRSAAAFGAGAVIFGVRRAAPLSPAAVKSAAGAVEYLDLVQETNIVRALKLLKDQGFWVAGLEADAAQTLWQADLRGRVALVVGNEGKGIRRLVRETCDFEVSIPITGPITSLNASVSAALALAECRRQRQG